MSSKAIIKNVFILCVLFSYEAYGSSAHEKDERLLLKLNVLRNSDIDKSSCGVTKGKYEFGVAKGDFNGDKIEDFAVLVKDGPPVNESRVFEKNEISYDKKIKISLFVYLSKKNGFKKIKLEEGEIANYIPYPVRFGLDLVGKGVYHDVNSDKKIILKRNGFIFFECEAFSHLYYWNEKTKAFEYIAVSD